MSNHEHTYTALLTGLPHHVTDLDKPVAERLHALLSAGDPRLSPRDPKQYNDFGFAYDGARCQPENVGWRFEQNNRPELAEHEATWGPEFVEAAIRGGAWDEQIVETYHDAASAEHWYRHEKD